MKKIAVKKQTKTAEILEVRRTAPKFIKTTLSFIGSFLVMVGFILGIYWYGKQAYQTVNGIVSPFITPRSIPSHITTQYYDPLDLIEAVRKQSKKIVVLDVRSEAEYKKEHIKYAVSVPLYTIENDTIQYRDVQEVIKNISADKSRLLVLYGPSTSFQPQQMIVSELKKNGYTAQLLAIGWNELRHFQNIWIPEGLWGKIDVNSILENNDAQ